MGKLKLVILIFSLSIILTSCFGPGLADYEYDLAGGYMLSRSSGHQIEVIPKGGWDSNNPPPIIPAKVVEIAWDERFIIAKQLGLKRAYPDNPDNTYEVPDNNKVNYWIMDTKEKHLYGPFDIKNFDPSRVKLKVPKTLKLKKVDAYNDN